MSIQACSEPQCSERAETGAILRVIESRAKDLGDFSVRRVLPAAAHQRVGPFIFFDHMGPATFPAGRGIDVRPHPHIGLSTVTYLFDGVIQHRDSLGYDQAITPGAVNWMTAGRGIVHSERSPDAERRATSTLHGLQVWLALPVDREETEPCFVHHPAAAMPRIERDGAHFTLIAGAFDGATSPVETASPTFYLAGQMAAGASLDLPSDVPERAVYVVEGSAELEGRPLAVGSMAVLRSGSAARLVATAASRVAVVGGEPLAGERHLWWNFVSSSRDRIERAKRDWREGRFASVAGDPEFIPLPEG